MPEPGFTLRRIVDEPSGLAHDVEAGLTAVRKAIPPRSFYDDLGSALFEAICELPEYYLTRAETELLSAYRGEIASALGPVSRIIELGSGNARKTRLLLDEMAPPGRTVEYVPVDIDVAMLQKVGRELLAEYPALVVTALSCNYRRPGVVVRELGAIEGKTCLFFLGSTVGNLELGEASAMLRDLRGLMKSGDSVLLGADLKKPKPILDAAYNDLLGVTAAFNLNVLQRINRELAGHFDLLSFGHRAFYDEALGRVEMHLVSLRDQSVRIDGLGIEISFVEGETIHTENSYKYDERMIGEIAARAGYSLARRWHDSKGWFGEFLLMAQ